MTSDIRLISLLFSDHLNLYFNDGPLPAVDHMGFYIWIHMGIWVCTTGKAALKMKNNYEFSKFQGCIAPAAAPMVLTSMSLFIVTVPISMKVGAISWMVGEEGGS